MERTKPPHEPSVQVRQVAPRRPVSKSDEEVEDFLRAVHRKNAMREAGIEAAAVDSAEAAEAAEEGSVAAPDGAAMPAVPGVPAGLAGGLAGVIGQAARGLTGQFAEGGLPDDEPQSPGFPAIAGPNDGGVILPAGVEAAPIEDAPGVADRRCGELVERILVAQPAADGSAEVRIRLDRSWLPDTEVRLTRTADGSLEVEFVSDQVEAQRFLLPNLSELRERLANRSGAPVAVRMSEHAESGANEGRSRNRRNLYEETSEG